MMTSSSTTHANQWTDPKRTWWSLGLLLPLFPLFSVGLWMTFEQIWVWYLTPLYVFGLVPLLDALIGEDPTNPPDDAVPDLVADRGYRRWLVAFVPMHWLTLAVGMSVLATQEFGVPATIGLVLSLGLVSAGGINVGHELGHKRGAVNGWLAKFALAPAFYGHFYVEHNRGHHARVSTPEDPASARLGEGFPGFWRRCVRDSLKSAWRLEQERLARSGLAWWHNHNLQAWALSIVLFAGLTAWLGWAVLGYLVIQAVIGFSLLELVNYVEHYGLKRARLDNGQYERPQPRHSWNSNHLVSNLMLFHLQRHSDHHAHGSRPYQALRHLPGAPQLPAGYSVMILLAMVPPLWRQVMDPRVAAHYRGDLSLANRV